MKSISRLIIAYLMLVSPLSHADFIVNGSFEDNTVNKGQWIWLNSGAVPGWEGSNIEIWREYSGVKAQHGNNFIELNAHGYNNGPWAIFQDISTQKGVSYYLSFFYRARTNNNEAFSVSFGDEKLVVSNPYKTYWSQFVHEFVAKSDTTRLTFISVSPTLSTVGNFIDNVTLFPLQNSIADVSEPQLKIGAFAFLILIALLYRRRSIKPVI